MVVVMFSLFVLISAALSFHFLHFFQIAHPWRFLIEHLSMVRISQMSATYLLCSNYDIIVRASAFVKGVVQWGNKPLKIAYVANIQLFLHVLIF